jgi:hypothetical protein
MSNPKTTQKIKGAIKAIILVGTLLIIIGIGLWLYTDSVIKGHEQILEDPNLTLDERNRWEGSLQWWKTAKLTKYGPISIILITMGLCALEYASIYVMVRPE